VCKRNPFIPRLISTGKTSIAYQYVKSRQEKFDAIFWLNADTKGKLASSFGRMALKLRLQGPEDDRDRVMSRDLVLQWLENPVTTYGRHTTEPRPKARWLLVFDNVDDFALMEDFWPPNGAGSVLMTSRAPHAERLAHYSGTDGDDELTHSIKLEPFAKEEAQEFLYKLTNQKHTPDSDEANAALNLAHRIQGYPLFLTQLAGMMNDGSSSFSDLLKMYNEESRQGKLHGARHQIRNSKYQDTTATVWMLDKLDPAARMVMNVLSFLDPDHIQEEVLTEGAVKIKAEYYPKTRTDYVLARDALWRRSLIKTEKDRSKRKSDHASTSKDDASTSVDASEKDIKSGIQHRLGEESVDQQREPKEDIEEQIMPQLTVHRVVQDVSRSQMTEEQQREAFDAAISLVLTRWNRNERLWHYDRKDWPRAEHLYPHVVHLQHFYKKFESEAQKNVASIDFVRLLDCAGW
jgi:hypothetical protein